MFEKKKRLKSGMKKMYYFMNVDVRWIKQRPHYLAEKLSKYFDAEIFFPHFYARRTLSNDCILNDCRQHRIFRVPNRIKAAFLHRLVERINRTFLKHKITVGKPDVLFLTDPEQVDYVPEDYKGIIVYDCMDDLVALAINDFKRRKVLYNESEIIKKSSLIFVSSQELKNVLNKRYSGQISNKKLILCRNAYNGSVANIESKNKNSVFTLVYFGTISSWFNMDLLLKSLEKYENIKYVLAGPIIEGVEIPKHNRIEYIGVIDHNSLDQLATKADCFVMPFLLNDVTKSVDPVKFYEYINYNKNIITIYYPEIERYSKFVDFYHDSETYFAAINYAMNNGVKYSNEERIQFLNENSWDNRADIIVRAINDLR